jgi:hypothetical protein
MGRDAKRWQRSDQPVIKKVKSARSKGKRATLRQNGKTVHVKGMPDDGGVWLERRLKALYASVLEEPLPEDMRKLVDLRK